MSPRRPEPSDHFDPLAGYSRAELITYLAREHRILAIVVPRGIAENDVKAIAGDVSARLEKLVAKRDRPRGES